MSDTKPIRMYLDGNLPIIVGDCPSCGVGDRSLILIDYVHNPVNEDRSTVYVKCVSCSNVFQTNIKEVSHG